MVRSIRSLFRDIAAVSGILPVSRLDRLLEPYSQAYPTRDFLMLVGHGLRSAIRYQRPFSVISIRIANAADLRGNIGAKATSATFASLLALIVDALRTCDSVTAKGDQIMLGLPETKAAQAGVVMWRLKKQVKDTIAANLRLECRVSMGPNGLELLKTLDGNAQSPQPARDKPAPAPQ